MSECQKCGCPSPLFPHELAPYVPPEPLDWITDGKPCPMCGSEEPAK